MKSLYASRLVALCLICCQPCQAGWNGNTSQVHRHQVAITLTWLPRRELRVRDWSGKIGGRSHGCEPDDCTVDVDSLGTVRCGLAGGRVDARQQVRPGGRQVEDD